ncbi:fructose-bisphosphate aldolase [Lachnospiraceae bacterium]|nr:fructose-bisphosphate aldolase [Lachnospiraceae bacterium]BDF39249.1 fructose-bisphosphate aldolase [Lachnospiraceae bacterium]
MLVSLQEMLQEAERNNFAIASINTPNQISLRAVIEAAEDTGMPVTINHAQTEESVVPIEIAVPLMLDYARKSTAAISVHVDHGFDFDHCMKAVRLGCTSIMYDCSRFPLEKNIEEVRRFVDIVKPLGIGVEAELGAMPNNMPSDVHGQETSDLSDLSVYFTDPKEAEVFCERSGCDVLTTSFGTVHGVYAGEPNLDIERIKKIKSLAGNVHLGMHGGSGTPFDQIQAAISAGIKKINYFTAIDTAPAPYLMKTIQESKNPVNFCNLANQAMEIIYERTVEVLNAFKNASHT